MELIDIISFKEPAGLAVGIFIILFAVLNFMLSKFMKENKTSVVVSFALSAIAAWQLYKERFYGWEETLAVSLWIMIIGVFLSFFIKLFRKKK